MFSLDSHNLFKIFSVFIHAFHHIISTPRQNEKGQPIVGMVVFWSRKLIMIQKRTKIKEHSNKHLPILITRKLKLLPYYRTTTRFLIIGPYKGQLCNPEITSWCLQFPPKNEQKQFDLRYHSSKVEFVRSFFGGNVILKKSFLICLTFTQARDQK